MKFNERIEEILNEGKALTAQKFINQYLKLDKRGNPITSSDTLVGLDKIISTIIPHGLIDQIAGSIGKVATEKETGLDAIFNRTLPAQRVLVSPTLQNIVRSRKLKEEIKRRQEEAVRQIMERE